MAKKKALQQPLPCPCGSGQPYANCCQPCHLGQAATTAAQLMRSRYSAYVLGLEDYLLQTWHPHTRPAKLGLVEDKNIQWLGLQVHRHRQIDAQNAEVAFTARYKLGGKAHKLVELSRFQRSGEHWLYVDGDLSEAAAR